MTMASALLRPDTGETAPAVTPAPVEQGVLDKLTTLADVVPAYLWQGLAAVVLLAVVVRAIRKRRGHRAAPKSDKLMTFFGAAVATGVVGTGMWAFFGDTLGIHNPYLRAALFAFFEIAMLASALRSRRFRLDRAAAQSKDDGDADSHEVDVDGVAVWVLALLSGTLAATHEHTAGAVGLRLVAPLIAAWLWERGLAGELRQFRRDTTRRTINWKISPVRVAVWLRLAEADDREVGQVDRARRVARFARTAYRLHTLETDKALRVRVAVARWRLRRQVEQINEHLSLATDRSVMVAVRAHLATLYQARTGTTPDSVADLTPWVTSEPIRVPATVGHPPAVGPGPMSDSASDTASRPTPDPLTDNEPHMTLDMLSALATRQPSDSLSGAPTGDAPDTLRDTATAPVSDRQTVSRRDSQPAARGRRTGPSDPTSGRAPQWTKQQLRAFKLRDENGLTHELIARRLNVTSRTVERWFQKREQSAAGDDKELALRPNIVVPLPAPAPPVMSGTNGYHLTDKETPHG